MRALSLVLIFLCACGSKGDAIVARDLGNNVLIDVPESWKLEVNDVTVAVLEDYPVRIAFALRADEATYQRVLDEQVADCKGKKVSETLPTGTVVRGCGGRVHFMFPIDDRRAITCKTMNAREQPLDPLADRVCRSLRKR